MSATPRTSAEDLRRPRWRPACSRDEVTSVDRGDVVLRPLLDPLHRACRVAGPARSPAAPRRRRRASSRSHHRRRGRSRAASIARMPVAIDRPTRADVRDLRRRHERELAGGRDPEARIQRGSIAFGISRGCS